MGSASMAARRSRVAFAPSAARSPRASSSAARRQHAPLEVRVDLERACASARASRYVSLMSTQPDASLLFRAGLLEGVAVLCAGERGPLGAEVERVGTHLGAEVRRWEAEAD